MFLRRLLKDKQLHINTVRYIFTSKGKKNLPLIGNNKIDLCHNFLDGITTLLKPFLVIAVIWAALKILILRHVVYDEMQIALSEIQVKIAYIKSLTFIEFIDTWKNWIFLVVIVVAVCVGSFKKWNERIGRFKNWISVVFGILSIISSLSFFSNDMVKFTANSDKKLKDLELQIIDIHENVYKNVSEKVFFNEVVEEMREDVNNQQREKRRMDSLHATAGKFFKNNEISEQLKQNLIIQILQIEKESDLVVALSQKSTHSYTDYFANFEPANTSQTTQNEEEYWGNPSNWNKGEGLAYLKASEDLNVTEALFGPQVEAKIKEFSQLLADCAVETAINTIVKGTPFEKIELGKYIISFFSGVKLGKAFMPYIRKMVILLKKRGANSTDIPAPEIFTSIGSASERSIASTNLHNAEFNAAIAAERKRIEADIQAAKLRAELERIAVLKQNAQKTIYRLVKEKLDRVIKGKDQINAEAYSKILRQMADAYLERIGLVNITSEAMLKKIISKRNIDLTGLPRIPITVIHPGLEATCPICAIKTHYGY